MSSVPKRVYPEDMPARQQPKREEKMRRIIEELRKTPIVELACERAGVPRANYYRWRANDFIFARAADHAQDQGRFIVNDLAESQLIRKIKSGDLHAIKYWLPHNHPRYAKKEIHEHCDICEQQSTEEKHREKRRELRGIEVVGRGIRNNPTFKEIDDRTERKEYEYGDQIYERFGMPDETENDEQAPPASEPGDQNSAQNA